MAQSELKVTRLRLSFVKEEMLKIKLNSNVNVYTRCEANNHYAIVDAQIKILEFVIKESENFDNMVKRKIF